MPRARLSLILILALAWAAPAMAQSGSVLGIVPEGAVIDAAAFPDMRPGARIGFRRPDASTPEVGEGWVLEIREGRALIGLKPGGTVQVGDVAASCATLPVPGSPEDLRATVQGLKTQLSASAGSAELQAAMGQLESALDVREAALRAGACDVGQHDQQIAAASLQLQQMLTSAPPSAAGAPPPPSANLPTAPPPDPGVPSPAGQGTMPTDLATALQVVQQLAQIAQSMGLVGGRGSSGGQPSGGASFPSPDVSSPPPPQALPIPEAPPPPPPLIVETPPPPPPPVAATPPPTPAGSRDSEPPVAAPPQPPTATPPGSSPPSGQPPVGRPPVVRQPGQWWTITPPKTNPPVVGAVPGTQSGPSDATTAPGRTTTPESGPAPDTTKPPILRTTPLPVLKLPPGSTTQPGVAKQPGSTTQPGTGPTARTTPPPQRMAVIQGVIRAENGTPIPGATVVVAGKQVATNAHGLFLVGDVPLGHQTLVVTARGFVQSKLAVELTSGEVEKVSLTLRRAPASSPAQGSR